MSRPITGHQNNQAEVAAETKADSQADSTSTDNVSARIDLYHLVVAAAVAAVADAVAIDLLVAATTTTISHKVLNVWYLI